MISMYSYTKEWIEEKIKEFPKKDPELIERVIMAFSLLERLQRSGLKFIFKGGTSLLLLLQNAHRFSIDIDIIVPFTPEDISVYLNKVTEDGVFLRYEKSDRKATGIPKAHYRFYYKSVLKDMEFPILLDILFEESPYSETKQIPIKSMFIFNEGEPIKVEVPSINCILGDKLTAYAPNTTGILYGVGKELEIIKQLYDVSRLFDLFDDINVVRNSFNSIVEKELEYRDIKELGPDDVLEDIFYTSCIIAFRGAKDKKSFAELSSGITKIKGYIYPENFIIESGVLSASKAAYLSMLLKSGANNIGERYSDKIDLNKVTITNTLFKKFNTIKKFSPQAFFYWYKSIELLDEYDIEKLSSRLA
jgi:predicted nucleotidyltransferase component of viral defense system